MQTSNPGLAVRQSSQNELKSQPSRVFRFFTPVLDRPASDPLSFQCSTRIGTLMGANQPQLARVASRAFIWVGLATGLTIGAVYAIFRRHLVSFFSSEPHIVHLGAQLFVVCAFYGIADGPQNVLQGILRGSTRHKVVALCVLAVEYPIGIPAAYMLAFWARLGIRGLWIGSLISLCVQFAVLFVIYLRTDWEEQAARAQRQVAAAKAVIKKAAAGLAAESDASTPWLQ